MTNNLDRAVLAITRIGSFSEGEKDALTKAFRTSGFPGNLSITNPINGEVLSYNGTDWVNATSAAGVTTFSALTDTPSSITANGFVKGSAGATALVYVTNVAETDAAETISAAWNFTTAPTINSNAVLTTANSIDALNDVDGTDKASGDYLSWNGSTNWVKLTPPTFNTIGGQPMTTNEDMIKRSGGVAARIPVGTSGQVLTVTGGVVGWANSAAGFADPMTTRGDIMVRNSVNTTARLAIGTTGKYLRSDGTDISWQTPTFSETSPMTTNEDIIKQSGGVATRLPVGTNNQVLTVTAGVVGWATPASGFSDPMTTRGDIIVRNASNTTARLGVGTNGQVLTSNGTDIVWGAGSAGSTTFLALTDTPSSYTGLSWLRANVGATALEWVTSPVTSVSVGSPITLGGTGTAPVVGIQASSGTVHGYMSSTQWTKLNGIEAGADVTDYANVVAAGAWMYNEVGTTAGTIAAGDHTHSTYALGDHTHSTYALTGHNHTGVYAPASHSHAIADLPVGTLGTQVAYGNHTHTGVYSAEGHNHIGVYATTGHDHNTVYAALSGATFSGGVTASSFTVSSARWLKDELGSFPASRIDDLFALNAMVYTFKDDADKKIRIGYYADEVARQYPELVGLNKEGVANSVDYAGLVVPIIEKMKQMELRMQDMERRMKEAGI